MYKIWKKIVMPQNRRAILLCKISEEKYTLEKSDSKAFIIKLMKNMLKKYLHPIIEEKYNYKIFWIKTIHDKVKTFTSKIFHSVKIQTKKLMKKIIFLPKSDEM